MSSETSMTTSSTMIRSIMSDLDLSAVTKHFNGAHEQDGVKPFVVCSGVSVDAFNEYVADGDALRIARRLLCREPTGELVILEYPVPKVHGSTVSEFERAFFRAAAKTDDIARILTSGRGTTVSQPGRPDKTADVMLGPKGSHTTPPQGRTLNDWFTVVVEVARSQSWASLVDAAEWWSSYVGLQYLLLLKISADGTGMQYAFYDIRAPSPKLPPATIEGKFRNAPELPLVTVSFNMYRVLGCSWLPTNVNSAANVNLCGVMAEVLECIE